MTTQQHLKFYESLRKQALLKHQLYKSFKTLEDLLLFIGHSKGELAYAYPPTQLSSPLTTETLKRLFNHYETTYQLVSITNAKEAKAARSGDQLSAFRSGGRGDDYRVESPTTPGNGLQSSDETKEVSNGISGGDRQHSCERSRDQAAKEEASSLKQEDSSRQQSLEGEVEVLLPTPVSYQPCAEFQSIGRLNRVTPVSEAEVNAALKVDEEIIKQKLEAIKLAHPDIPAFLEKYDPPTTLSAPNSTPSRERDEEPIPYISRLPSTKFFVHQSKAIRKGLKDLVEENKRAIMVMAGTGTGKTFIAGGLLEQLWNPSLSFFKGCISPWPCIYITRASIVEQTQRVLRDQFGLDPVRQCTVVNVEQFRSNFGKSFLKVKTVVKGGVESITWNWIPIIAPRLFVIDESHMAKNDTSTQSMIIQSMSELPSTRIIFMSATSFLRVSEARYFCVNTHKEIK